MKSNLKSALVAGSTLGVVLGLLAITPAYAQPTDPQAAEAADEAKAKENSEDEVVIVGSRIRRDTFNSPSPVQIVTREETLLAGYNSATAALQGTAVTGGTAQINNAYGGFVTNGGPGANTLSLRGLGATRTLVLLNGRRVAPAGSRGSVGSADLNVLPNAMIERIEILKDGASSIYGSDAVAGVVNIITENKFDGITVEGQYNWAENGGGDEGRFSVVAGTHGDRWSIAGSAEYYQRFELNLGDRDWTACNRGYKFNKTTGVTTDYIDPATGQPKCYTITGTGENGSTINTLGTQNFSTNPLASNYLAGIVRAPGASTAAVETFNRFRPNAAAATGLIGFEGVGGGTNNINVRDVFEPRMLNRSLISPVKVYTAYGQGSFDLEALGAAQLYAEVLVNKRESEQTGYRQLTIDYPLGSPLIPSSLSFLSFSGGSPVSGAATNQAIGARAFIGFGNDHSEQSVKFGKVLGGIRGDLTFLPTWRYDAYVSFTRSDAEYTSSAFLINRLWRAVDVVTAPVGSTAAKVKAADGVTDLVCRSTTASPGALGADAACVPAPALTAAVIGGTLPQNYRDYIFRPVTGTTKYDETVFNVTLDGTLFTLPSGDIKAAIGGEFRRAKIDDTPSADSQAGNLYNSTSSTLTRGSDQVWEAFGEVEVPVVRDQPWMHDLTVNLSGRYTNYKSYGADNTYKVGLVVTPIKQISFRGSYGTSYRAPALFEQFQGSQSGFLNQSSDPCNNYGVLDPASNRYKNCLAELGSNPDGGNFSQKSGLTVYTQGGAATGLEAETSQNLTVGVILQPTMPEWFGDLSMAVDYFSIKVNNGVSRVGSGNIISKCYDDPLFRAGGGLCNLIIRGPASSNYSLTIYDSYTNIATDVVKGYDFNFRYVREVGPGRLRLNTALTKFIFQGSKVFKTDPLRDANGSINAPKWTGTFDATYTVDHFKFRYGVEWIAAMQSYDYLKVARTSTSILDVPDYFLHSASVQYTMTDLDITFGVRNLADEEPPVISAGNYNRVGNAPLYSGYDYVGRTWFLNVSKHF